MVCFKAQSGDGPSSPALPAASAPSPSERLPAPQQPFALSPADVHQFSLSLRWQPQPASNELLVIGHKILSRNSALVSLLPG